MQVSFSEIQQLSNTFLQKLGLSLEEAEATTTNLFEAEVSGKNTHGFVRLPWIKTQIESGKIKVNGPEIEVEKETNSSFLLNGQMKIGYFVISEALRTGFQKVKQNGVCIVATMNTGPTSGYLSHYARMATYEETILIATSGSVGRLVPFGSSEPLWGTAPLAIGIPSSADPVIFDASLAKITIGEVLLAKALNKPLPTNVAVNKEGEMTQKPEDVLDGGGVLPIAEQKGSGLAFALSLLAGPLISSLLGNEVKGGWGNLFILIDPTIFRPLSEFKQDVDKAISELKNARKEKGVEEIYFPGEQSQKKRTTILQRGFLEVNETVLKQLCEVSV